ncbi:hypothetical protein ACLKTS_003007, partial [Salmonella enterica subsp. enterica serovar 44:z4,z24:-]
NTDNPAIIASNVAGYLKTWHVRADVNGHSGTALQRFICARDISSCACNKDTAGRVQELLTEDGTLVWRDKQQLWDRDESRNR